MLEFKWQTKGNVYNNKNLLAIYNAIDYLISINNAGTYILRRIKMQTTLLKTIRLALVCGATLVPMSEAYAGWNKMVAELNEISEQSQSSLRQLTNDKVEGKRPDKKWIKRRNLLNNLDLNSFKNLDDLKRYLDDRISFEPYKEALIPMMHFLDPSSLRAFAKTHKAAVPMVARELRDRIKRLGNKVRSQDAEDGYFLNGMFVIKKISYIPLPPAQHQPTEELQELTACVLPMLTVSLLSNEENPLLRLQATSLILNEELRRSNPVQLPLYVKNTFNAAFLKPSLSQFLEDVCVQPVIQKLSSTQDSELSVEDSQLLNTCHAMVASLRMTNGSRTLDDVRVAANALNSITYFGDYPTSLRDKVMSNLVNRPYEIEYEPAFTGGNLVNLGETHSRSKEEKSQDFDILQKVFHHAFHFLGGDEPNDFTDMSCGVTNYTSWSLCRPALRSEKQAEMFKKRDLDKFFK